MNTKVQDVAHLLRTSLLALEEECQNMVKQEKVEFVKLGELAKARRNINLSLKILEKHV